jgi:phage gp29-like protein
VPLNSNYPRRRLSAIVEGQRPSTPQGAHYGDLRQWAGQVVEKVRVASVGGRLRFLPWYDPYSDETPEMRQEYRHMLRESSVKAAFQTKVLSVIAEDVQFQPDNEDDPREKEAASFYAYAFKKLSTVDLGWSILHPAIMDGHSVCEKVWDPEPLRTGKFRGKRLFKYVKAKDTHFLQLGIDPYRNITAIRGTGFNASRVYSPSDFIIFSYFSLFENPAGMSDFRAAYRPFWIKDTLWKLRALHLEKWTGPFIVGHYSTQESRQALEEAFDQAKASTWLTVPVGEVIECMDLAMKGTTDFKDGIADCDREILIAIVGAHLQILEGQTGGARGNTKVHKEIGELIQWWLAAKLADVYREQLVIPLKEENYWDVEACDVSIGAVTDEAMIERLKVYEGMQKLGLKLSQKAAYRSFNMQPPEDPDDVLTAPGAGGQGPGGPAPPGGSPMPPAGPGQGGGNGQAFAEWQCFDDVYHGPAPPGSGWVSAGVGPHGGKMWKRAGKGGGKAGDKGPLPKLTARQRQQAWDGSAAEPRRLTLPPDPNSTSTADRGVEVKPLDDVHSLYRDAAGKIGVARTADLERVASQHAAQEQRRREHEAGRQADYEAKVKDVRPKIDPALAAGVRQVLQHGPVSEASLLDALTLSGPKLPEDAARLLLRRMAFVGDLATSTSGGKTKYRLPEAGRAVGMSEAEEDDPLRDLILGGARPVWDPDNGGWVVGDQPDDEEDDGSHPFDERPRAIAFASSWVGFQTRTGKQGWRNSVTGERRYQPKAPEERGEEYYQQQHQQRQARAEAKLNAPPKAAPLPESARGKLVDFFAGGVKAEDLPALVGALPGSTVTASSWGTSDRVTLEVEGPRYIDCRRTLIAQPDGRLIVHNDMFFLRRKYKGGGQGAKQFSDQVRECARLGVDEIETLAGKGSLYGAPMTGYQAWPALGYDASLEDAKKAGMPPLPPELAGATTLQELFALPGGEDWWSGPRGEDGRRKPGGGHGVMMTMRFDLTPGSPSLKRLNGYLAKKGMPAVEVSAEGGTPQERRKAAAAPLRQEKERKAQEQQAAEAALRREWQDVHEDFALAARRAGFSPDHVRGAVQPRLNAMADQRAAGSAYTRSSNADLLRTAYYDEINDLTMQRHLKRLESPAALPISQAWGQRAQRLGIDVEELDHEVRKHPVGLPDAEQSLRRSYARALSALVRRAGSKGEAGGPG